jgi:hypothetical protein
MKNHKVLAVVALLAAIVVAPLGLVFSLWNGGIKAFIGRVVNALTIVKEEWNYEE